MKALAAAAAALALFVASDASSLEPGVARVRVTAQLEAVARDVQIFGLYNRPAYPGRLGTAFVNCIPLTRQFADCYETLRLGRGQIVARGIVSQFSKFHVLAIVGGTGLYSNVGGELVVQPVGGPYQLVLADIRAY